MSGARLPGRRLRQAAFVVALAAAAAGVAAVSLSRGLFDDTVCLLERNCGAPWATVRDAASVDLLAHALARDAMALYLAEGPGEASALRLRLAGDSQALEVALARLDARTLPPAAEAALQRVKALRRSGVAAVARMAAELEHDQRDRARTLLLDDALLQLDRLQHQARELHERIEDGADAARARRAAAPA